MKSIPGYLGSFVTLLCLGAAAAHAQARVQVKEEVRQYRSGEARVTIECFWPAAEGKYPTVLLLHGSGGLEEATGDLFRQIARRLVQEGYVVLIPHYFERTRHVVGAKFGPNDIPSYVQAVHDAIEFAAASRVVDSERIGLVGWSLGSYIAFFRSARDPRIKAMVSVSGYVPLESKSQFPPVLILQGANDPDTSPRRLKAFEQKLEAGKTPCETHIYPGVGHNLDPLAWADARRRTAVFFNNHLKQTAPQETAR
jgi:carboxymethylenebutenolidase